MEEIRPKETEPKEQSQQLDVVPATVVLGALQKAQREIEANMVTFDVAENQEN